MARRHNWFFALRPAAADARRLHAFGQRLCAGLEVVRKPIGPERLHVTLQLIGHDDLDPQVVAAACEAADRVDAAAFEVQFDAAMSFHAARGPFVLLGGSGLEATRALRTLLGCRLVDRGFEVGDTFNPHMTLGYDDRIRIREAVPIEPIGFRATAFVLIRSHIGFSRHEVVRAWPLQT